MTTIQQAPSFTRPISNLREAMLADHAAISTTFDDVMAAFRSGNCDEAAAMFGEFERRLERHLAFEDEALLPALRRDHPEEAAALDDDHRRIRVRLIELAIGVDLHLTRATWVAEFVEMLRAHAQREDALLYRWASEPSSHLDATRTLRSLAAL